MSDSNTLRDELVALTSALVAFPSTAEQPEQLVAVIDYLATYLATIPDIFVERSEVGGKPALVATLRQTRSPALLINGHADVVAGRPEQFRAELRNNRLYGRGSQDMKGSLAVMLRLLKDLAGLPNRPDIGFQFVSDEEIGGTLGTERLLQEGWRCDFMVCLEPTNLDILYEHKGGMWIEVRLPGVPAHASRPWAGRNPLPALGAGLLALEKRFPQPGPDEWRSTVTPTSVTTGGNSRNQVPSVAELTVDVRFVAEDDPEQLAAAVAACFPEAQVEVKTCGPGLITDPDAPAVQRLAATVAKRIGRQPRFYREHFATDARFYTIAGMPAVCLGPVGAGLHSDEEWVEVDSLVDLYTLLRDFATQ